MSYESWKQNYELLKQAGHSPAKAGEIAVDANRGDKYALQWIEAVKIRTKDEVQ